MNAKKVLNLLSCMSSVIFMIDGFKTSYFFVFSVLSYANYSEFHKLQA